MSALIILLTAETIVLKTCFNHIPQFPVPKPMEVTFCLS